MAARNNYPARLTEHLKSMSQVQNDAMKMYTEWYFVGTIDTGTADRNCPCGKQGIRYLCTIRNKHTTMSTRAGTTCIELFDEEMKEVLKLVYGLISTHIRGKYKGVSRRSGRHRFEIRANTRLVKKSPFLKSHVKYVQIYQTFNRKWEIQVLFDITVPPILRQDSLYHLRMKCTRWENDYGKGMVTGITFRVIECLEV